MGREARAAWRLCRVRSSGRRSALSIASTTQPCGKNTLCTSRRIRFADIAWNGTAASKSSRPVSYLHPHEELAGRHCPISSGTQSRKSCDGVPGMTSREPSDLSASSPGCARSHPGEQLRDRGRVSRCSGPGISPGAKFVVSTDSPSRSSSSPTTTRTSKGCSCPGRGYQFLPSSELVKREIDLCLMTVRPEIEDAVIANNATFTARGGILASVFPGSPLLVRPSNSHCPWRCSHEWASSCRR